MVPSIGCQGWKYDDWTTRAGGETVFFPRGTKAAEMLGLYARVFGSVEIDSTFYAVPSAASVENWYRRTPAGFTFSPKVPREITHEHLLGESARPVLDAFCERVSELREKLAVCLLQLPPSFSAIRQNAVNLRRFLSFLPSGIRFAVEFREPGWMVDWTFAELAGRGLATALVDGSWIPRARFFEAAGRLSGDFAYVRFMGDRDLESFDRVVRPRDAVLEHWRHAIESVPAREKFVYFSNFFEGHAPASAFKLSRLFGLNPPDPAVLEEQGNLF
jgi:uncharacterized protein YecE (DUF72 family)